MKAKEFEVKPRNFVAKNAKMGGAGQHKDKKKAEKQGDAKHKKQLVPMESIEQKLARKIQENIEQGVAVESNPEYDDEAGMSDNNLETLKRSVAGIDELIQPGDNLPEWCQEKIAIANSMLVTVWDYMLSEKESENGRK